MAEILTLNVTINGTGHNPWVKMGLRQNPFPQIARAEFATGMRQLASLDAEPIRTRDEIRRRLRGFAPEFVELCVSQFRPGYRTRFTVTFPSGREF